MRNLGSIKKNVHIYEGLNSRLDTLQASILIEKLNHTLKHNDSRREISNYYDQELLFLDNIKLTETNLGSSRHLYVIRTNKRKSFLKFMKKNGVNCQLHYPYSLNKIAALKNKIKKVKLPISEKWSKECVSLPLYPNMPLNDAKRVVTLIKNFLIE